MHDMGKCWLAHKARLRRSAYLYFVADNRARIKQENPGKGFTDVARLLGVEWRRLTDEQKTVSCAAAAAAVRLAT